MSLNGHSPLVPGSPEWSAARHNLAVHEERLQRLHRLRDRLPPEIVHTERLIFDLRIRLGLIESPAARMGALGAVRDRVLEALATPASLDELRSRCPDLGDAQIVNALGALRAKRLIEKPATRGARYRRTTRAHSGGEG